MIAAGAGSASIFRRGLIVNAMLPNLAIKPRSGSLISPELLAAQTTAWSLRLSHENTFLSWGRNAIISTVAGVALVQYRRNEGRPPLPAFGLLCMGGLYMCTGSFAYVLSAVFLRHAMRLNPRDLVWISIQASWPVCVWGLSFLCMLDEEPDWLMDVLRLSRLFLPLALHDHLYLADAEHVLAPITQLAEVIAAHESSRLRAGEYQRWWHVTGQRFFDMGALPAMQSTEETKVLSRQMKLVCTSLAELALKAKNSPDESVAAIEVVPLLHGLLVLVNQLEVSIEKDIAGLYDRPLWGRIAVVWSRVEQILADELEIVRALRRRVMAVSVMPKVNMPRRDSD